MAGAYYVARDFNKAKEHALQALPYFQDDPHMLAETLRGLMLDYSNLNDLKGFLSFKKQADEAIENAIITSPMDMAILLEGCGKSKIQFGDMDAISYIDKAEKEMKKINTEKKNGPFRYLQIHRTRLDYYLKMKSLGKTLDQRIIRENAQNALNSLMTLPDYARHQSEIKTLIQRLEIIPYLSPLGCEQMRFF